MDAYHAVSVTLGLVIGLGVARLLSSSVNVFKSRDTAQVDWIPLAWAGCVFLWQLQFWWAIVELPSLVDTWTILEFGLLLGMTLLLYVAAALILPTTDTIHSDSLTAMFQRDGRWALVMLSLYFVLAVVVNWYLFRVPPFGYPEALNILLAVLPLVYLRQRTRRGQVVATVLYVVISLWAAWEMSPHAYSGA
jgi:hypothetical protein